MNYDLKKVKEAKEHWENKAHEFKNQKDDLQAENVKKGNRISKLEAELKEANETKDAFNHEIDKIESQLINAEAASSDEEVDFYKSTAQLYFKQWKEEVRS